MVASIMFHKMQLHVYIIIPGLSYLYNRKIIIAAKYINVIDLICNF